MSNCAVQAAAAFPHAQPVAPAQVHAAGVCGAGRLVQLTRGDEALYRSMTDRGEYPILVHMDGRKYGGHRTLLVLQTVAKALAAFADTPVAKVKAHLKTWKVPDCPLQVDPAAGGQFALLFLEYVLARCPGNVTWDSSLRAPVAELPQRPPSQVVDSPRPVFFAHALRSPSGKDWSSLFTETLFISGDAEALRRLSLASLLQQWMDAGLACTDAGALAAALQPLPRHVRDAIHHIEWYLSQERWRALRRRAGTGLDRWVQQLEADLRESIRK
eukprot:jgi/Ulvmu1/3466/UM016_0086.1